jgi:hypothetical protein
MNVVLIYSTYLLFLSELERTGVTRRLLWEEYKKEFTAGY